MITACWYQDGVWRQDSIRIGAVLGRQEDGGIQAGTGAAWQNTGSELSQMEVVSIKV